MHGYGNHKQKLTWPEWCRKPENQKLVKENIGKAKIKYNHDLHLAEQYNRYMMMMMGYLTPAAAAGGGSTRSAKKDTSGETRFKGIGNYIIGNYTALYDQFIVN